MKWKSSAAMIFLVITVARAAQSPPADGTRFDNQYLAIMILSGWTLGPSADQKLNLIKGKYLLTVNPIFTHASPIEGGRFSEIVEGMPSLEAVTRNVDRPAIGDECAQSDVTKATVSISLVNLYTDSSKRREACVFPSSDTPVWFGSYFSGAASESDYTITLSYDTADVNTLPKKGSPELRQLLAETVLMLKTLLLKPPIVISNVSPTSAPPGATVTVYGHGFSLFNSNATASFVGIAEDLNAVVAGDGKSLTFEVPTSILAVSCQEGRILIGGFCLPVPANHVDINDCPRKDDGSSNFCGIPIPPATYQLAVTSGGVSTAFVPFIVSAPRPTPVRILLMYPISFVSTGNTVKVRGSGFTASGNSVRIGDAVVSNVFSAEGTTITFRAPAPSGRSLIPGFQIFKASVFNANGQSNSISFSYR